VTPSNVTDTPWQLQLTHTAMKAQRKLDRPLREKIMAALTRIAALPEQVGEALRSPLQGTYSHHFTYHGKEFRIAYQVLAQQATVIVLLIGPHENFYRQLKQVLSYSRCA
jgi:mRNA interferase RelE/StbE